MRCTNSTFPHIAWGAFRIEYVSLDSPMQLWTDSIGCPPDVRSVPLHVTLDLWLTLLTMVMHSPSSL